jgi:tetratricopeptide (TPR) repeat protein
MRILAALTAAMLVLGTTPWALADDAPTKESGQVGTGAPTTRLATEDAATPSRADQLDTLFKQLKAAKSQAEATSIENSIAAIWLKSGSDTVDLLMTWTEDAIHQKNYSLALDYLDRVITLKPDYAEGWNTRATVEYLKDDYGRSMADIERTLKLEPRHFGALVGLGTILQDIGQDKQALEVYRYVIGLDPHLDNVRDAIKDLTDKGADGRDG